jgi:hypothetical protein
MPANLDASRGRAHEAAGDLRQCRLAGAVGSEQADQLALADLEAYATKSRRAGVRLRDVVSDQGRGVSAAGHPTGG